MNALDSKLMATTPLLCKCGRAPVFFGEALMSSLGCRKCEEFVLVVDKQRQVLIAAWNEGKRGMQ